MVLVLTGKALVTKIVHIAIIYYTEIRKLII